ncbi:MAG: tetratricopeptide repeat-containing sensor histidine kinase [Bacteroidota bacterium]
MPKHKKYIALILFLLTQVTITLAAEPESVKEIKLRIAEINHKKEDSVFAFTETYNIINASKKLNYKTGEVAGTMMLGYLTFLHGNIEKAGVYLYEAYETNKGLHDDTLMAQNLRYLGIYHDERFELNKAIDYFFQSLQIRQRLKDKRGIAECYNSIGVVYAHNDKINRAVEYYKKALAYFESENIAYKISAICNNLGSAYQNLNMPDSSIYFLNKAAKYNLINKDNYGLSRIYHNLATANLELGNFDKAYALYHQSIKSQGGGEGNSNNLNSYSAIGRLLMRHHRRKEAEVYLNKALNMSFEHNLPSSRLEIYSFLIELKYDLGDFKSSLALKRLHKNLYDSLENGNDIQILLETETKYQTLAKESENQLLTVQNNLLQQRSINNAYLAVALFVVLAISTFLAISLNKTRKAKQLLHTKSEEITSKNEQLEHLVQENQGLIGILAHDLRSPFSKIIGLRNLVAHEDDEHEKETYLNYIEKISREGLRLIQDTIDLSRISNPKMYGQSHKMEYFNAKETVRDMVNGFKAIANEKSIEISLKEGDGDYNIYSSKEYFSRIIDNLLSNAIKFSPDKSKITFSTAIENDKALFKIKDQGPGLSDDDKEKLFLRFQKLSARPTASESSTGLGLFIVKQLADLINGDITVNSIQGQGAEFVLTLPLMHEESNNTDPVLASN